MWEPCVHMLDDKSHEEVIEDGSHVYMVARAIRSWRTDLVYMYR